MVPERPDRARERAGHRRPLRALRPRGRGEEPHAVVLPDHRLRRCPARRDVAAGGLAGPRPHDAAELDRPLAGRSGRLQRRRERGGATGLHDAPGHALRSHVLRARAGEPDGDAARRGVGARDGGARLRPACGGPLRGRARGEGEGRRLHRALRGQSGERRADPDLGRRLRPDGLRHRRDHGGARARRARLRVRGALRAARYARSWCRRAATCRTPERTRPIPRTRCSSTRTGSTGSRAPRPRSGSSPGSPSAGSERRRSAIACATGSSRGSATGAVRSRSSTAPRVARCPCRTTSSLFSCPTSPRSPRRAARLSRPQRTGSTRPVRSAAARPSARRTRWTRSSTRPGTSSAIPIRPTTRSRSSAPSPTTGCPSTSTSAASSMPCSISSTRGSSPRS